MLLRCMYDLHHRHDEVSSITVEYPKASQGRIMINIMIKFLGCVWL